MFLCVAVPVKAQERPGPALDFSAGVLSFPDDGGGVQETMIGGGARFYLSPRVAIGPELSFIDGDDHSHVILTGNVTFDFIGPSGGHRPALTPFVVAGAGLYTTRESFVSGPYRHTEGAFTAGGGVRAAFGGRLTAAVDVRVGWELHLRVNGTLGIGF
jgi:hypothetical protein